MRSSNSLVREVTLRHSMRESGVHLDAICMSETTGNILTVDSAAVRLWTLQRQMKSYHISAESELRFCRALGCFHVEALDVFVVIYGLKKDRDEDDDEPTPAHGGMIEIWSSSLRLMQQITLNYLPLKRYAIDQNKCQIVLVDNTEACYVLRIHHKYVSQGRIPHFRTSKGNSPSKLKQAPIIDDIQLDDKLVIFVLETQRISFDDPEMILDVQFVRKNTFVLMYASSMVVYKCDSDDADYSMPHSNPNLSTRGITIDSSGSDGTYAIVNEFFLSCPDSSFPCSYISLDDMRFAIAFSNGKVQILESNIEVPSEGSSMNLLLEFQAHDSVGNPRAFSLVNCSWSSIGPGGHEMEFITVGPDRKIKVWGIRTTPSSSNVGDEDETVYSQSGLASLTDVPLSAEMCVVELLGQYKIVADPTSKVLPKNVQRYRITRSQILSYELTSSFGGNIPVRRELLCCFGGMLASLEVHQPYRSIAHFREKDKVVDSCSGPDISHFLGNQNPTSRYGTARSGNSTILLLHNECVDVVDAGSGRSVQQVSTEYLPDQRKPMIKQIGLNNKFNDLVREQEGRPTAVHWCPINNVIVVGYSTGGVAVINPPGKGVKKHIDINAIVVHDSSIRKFYSFFQPVKREFNTYLLTGDEKGRITLFRYSSSKSEYTLVESYEAHQGAILYMKSITGVNTDKTNPSGLNKIIITACSGGIVKAWIQEPNGKLQLNSFFKTKQGAMESFLPLLLVNTASIADKNSLVAAPESVESTMIASIDGSHGSYAEESGEIYVQILCLCGLVSGLVESWNLSTNDDKTINNASTVSNMLASRWILPCHDAPITSIFEMRCSEEDILKQSAYQIACSSEAGSTIILKIDGNGELLNQTKFFTLPIVCRNILPYVIKSDSHFDQFVAISDTKIVEISPSVRRDISKRWKALLNNANENVNDMDDEIFKEIGDYENKSLLESFTGADEEKLETSSKEDTTEEEILTAQYYSDAQFLEVAESNQLYTESIKSLQRAVTADLFQVKKDPELIRLFRQSNKQHKSQEIDCDTAIEIIHSWCNSETIDKNSVWETMLLLGIKKGDMLNFIKVAKAGALASVVSKRQEKESLEDLGVEPRDKNKSTWGDYRKLKGSKKIVSYNHMGEASVEDVGMLDIVSGGIADGNCEKFHRSWSNQPSRLLDSYNASLSFSHVAQTQLEKIPKKFEAHFKSKFLIPVELPTTWDSKNPHWFDLRRAVRVARTIFDMRATKQREIAIQHPNPDEDMLVTDLPNITCIYFERNFGHGRLNISNHKIVHYLEACLQYIHCPIINFIQLFNCPTRSIDEPSETCLWIFVELRQLLQIRGYITDGCAIPSSEFSGLNDTISMVNDSAQLKWQIVSRTNAKLAIDEMFQKRGNYGVKCIDKLFQCVDVLPDAEHEGNTPMIDAEVFLFSVVMEFQKIEYLLKEIDNTLFDAKEIPMYRIATSRDIVTEIPEKIPINLLQRNVYLKYSMGRVRSLAVQFIYNDPKRSGHVDPVTFRSIIVIAGQAILGFDTGRDAHVLADESVSRFRGHDPAGEICYADFIATLIGHLVQNQAGNVGMDGLEATKAVRTLKIGIGTKQAASIIVMIGLIQAPPEDNPLWTAGSREEESKGSISKEGQWVVKEPLVDIDDESIVIARSLVGAEELNPEKPGIEVRKMKSTMSLTSHSYVPYTDRIMVSSVSGEIVNLSKTGVAFNSKNLAPLHVSQMMIEDGATLQMNKPKMEDLNMTVPPSTKVTTGSYSRSISELLDMPYDVHPRDPNSIGISNSNASVDSIRSEPSFPVPVRAKEQIKSTQLNKSANNANSIKFQTGNYQREKLASDEVDRRKNSLIDEEQELLRQIEMEQEKFSRKRAMTVVHQGKVKAEARAKERMTMRFKAKQDRLRYERGAAGRELYANALKQQEMDIKKMNAEQFGKQQAEKEKQRAIKFEKAREEEAEKEKIRETQEGILMRAQEKSSHEYEMARAEKEEKEREEREAKEAAEAKALAEKREKERIAEEARLAAEAKKAAEEQAARDEEIARTEVKLMKEEDFNILTIPTPEELAILAEEARIAEEEETKRIAEEEEKAAAEAAAAEAAEAAKRAKTPKSGRRTPKSRAKTPKSSGSVGEGLVGTELEEFSSDEEEELTPLEQKMTNFLDKMKLANQRNLQHPRRDGAKNNYFMPMLFSDDIKYNNFEIPMNDEAKRLSEWTIDVLGEPKKKPPPTVNLDVNENKSEFSDIAQAVKDHKAKLIRDRLENLYKTSSTEDSSADWTEVIKKDVVEWPTFFDAQEAILMQRPPTPPPAIDEEAEFYKKIEAMAQELKNVPDEDESIYLYGVPESLPVPTDKLVASVTPLPLGKVSRDVVMKNSYKYYQIEVIEPYSSITFELKSVRGYADLYISKPNEEVLPTMYNHDRRAHAGDHNNRISRMKFSPGRKCTLIAGVYSELGSQFELWGFSSGTVPVSSEHIQNVSKNLRRWEIVQNHTVEEMDMKLPELMVEANNIVQFETSMARPSILAEYHANGFQRSEDDEDDEIDIMDTFISKAGRRLIRKDLLAETGTAEKVSGMIIPSGAAVEEEADSDDDDEPVDPNSHVELFKKPNLLSNKGYVDLVKGPGFWNERDNLNFSVREFQRRKTNGKRLNPMSMSLPNLNISNNLTTSSIDSTDMLAITREKKWQKLKKTMQQESKKPMKPITYAARTQQEISASRKKGIPGKKN